MSDDSLLRHVLRFVRALRAAGLPSTGTAAFIDALSALALVGVATREGVYWALASVLLTRREDQFLFDQAFELFWGEQAFGVQSKLPDTPGALQPPPKSALSPRLAHALGREQAPRQLALAKHESESERVGGYSAREASQKKDFEQMTARELTETQLALRELTVVIPRIRNRRWRESHAGARLDWRATLRTQVRSGLEVALKFQAPSERPVPIVALADVSGSMERYTRVFLHFLHALANSQPNVSVFLFGTRLTNVTRHLRRRDADVALAAVTHGAADWGSGTRIGACLHEFNRAWSRRVLAQRTAVLIVTDGLDRENTDLLAAEMQRLKRSCARLLWLNPLLRFAAFQPKAAGVRAMLPHVDAMLPVHNLASVRQLASAFAALVSPRLGAATGRAPAAREGWSYR